MKIEAEIITMFISIVFALLGFFIWLFSGDVFAWIWITSFLGLLGSYTINLVDRIQFEQEDRRVHTMTVEELEKLDIQLKRMGDI